MSRVSIFTAFLISIFASLVFLLLLLFVVIVLLPGEASAAQQEQRSSADLDPEVQHICRQKIRKLCRIVIPSRAAIERCVAENEGKLPEQCVALFRAQQQ